MAAYNLAQTAVKVVNALGKGKTVEIKKLALHSTPADLLQRVNEITGSQGEAGKIPAIFPDVKPPARLNK